MTAEYVLVDWAAVWGAVRVREELASQLSTVAVVGKKRTRGSRRAPHESSGWRCWRPNSTRPGFEFARHDAHLADRQVKRRARQPAVDGGGGGEEADAGQLSGAPRVVGLALLEAELDATAVEFARHDAHGRAVAAGGVLLGGGSGGDDGAAQDGE